jgi:hypothetical protein
VLSSTFNVLSPGTAWVVSAAVTVVRNLRRHRVSRIVIEIDARIDLDPRLEGRGRRRDRLARLAIGDEQRVAAPMAPGLES